MCTEKKLKKWQAAGLVDALQCQKILEYEKTRTRPFLKYGLWALAAYLIGQGIVALIALNWDRINDALKIGTGFALMGVASYGAWRAYGARKDGIFDACLFGFSLLTAGQVGLLIQIFQLQSALTYLLLLCLLPMLPLLFFCRSRVLPLLWIPITYQGVINVLFSENRAEFLKLENVWPGIFSLVLAMVLLLFGQVSKYRFREKYVGLQRAAQVWLIGILAYEILLTDIFYATNLDIFVQTFTAVVMALSVITIAVSVYLGRAQKNGYLATSWLGLIILGHIFPSGCVVTLAAGGCLGYYAYREHRIGLVNLALALIGVRLFILYCDNTFDLWGGVGFIGAGILLIVFILTGQKFSSYLKGKMSQ